MYGPGCILKDEGLCKKTISDPRFAGSDDFFFHRMLGEIIFHLVPGMMFLLIFFTGSRGSWMNPLWQIKAISGGGAHSGSAQSWCEGEGCGR